VLHQKRTFSPAVPGLQNGTVTFSGNTPIPTIALSGTGIQPSLQLAPASLSFPATTVTLTSAPQTVTITNTGASSLIITSITTSSEFDSTNNCPASLASNNSCQATVTFTPTASGNRTGALTIVSNSGTSPQLVSLTGIGADYQLSVAGSSSSTATVAPGSSATYRVSITSLNYSHPVDLICLGAPPAGICRVQPESVQLTGSNTSART
jgi:hypothetical protein